MLLQLLAEEYALEALVILHSQHKQYPEQLSQHEVNYIKFCWIFWSISPVI